MDEKYIAFISYRHHPLDTAVAMDVQHRLEHYRIPSPIRKQTGRKEIGRIFRDREELPITADINTSIADALKEAAYLILICSSHTAESTWVAREIDLFLKYHDKQHIITVIADGEPSDVIPKILLRDTRVQKAEDGTEYTEEYSLEPLSCDYRLPRRQARKEEIPRLAAAILGVPYDALRQRQHQYELRHRTVIFSVILAAAAVFLIYFMYSNRQISENLTLAHHNQSVYLTNEAARLSAAGDTLKAMELALAACPEEETQQNELPQLYRLMAQQVSAYQNPNERWLVSERLKINFDGYDVLACRVFHDPNRLIAFAENGQLTLADLDSYKTRKTLDLSDMSTWDENEILPYGADKALFVRRSYSGVRAFCIDLENGNMVWSREHEMDGCEKFLAFSGDRNPDYLLVGSDASFGNLDSGATRIRILRINGKTGETLLDADIPLSAGYDLPDVDAFPLGDGNSVFLRTTVRRDAGDVVKCFILNTASGDFKESPILTDERVILDVQTGQDGTAFFLCRNEEEKDPGALSLVAVDPSGEARMDKDLGLTSPPRSDGRFGTVCLNILPSGSGCAAAEKNADPALPETPDPADHTAVPDGAILVVTDTFAAAIDPDTGTLVSHCSIYMEGLDHILSTGILEDGTFCTFWQSGKCISIDLDAETASETKDFGVSDPSAFFAQDHEETGRQWILAKDDTISIYAQDLSGDDGSTLLAGSRNYAGDRVGSDGAVQKSIQSGDRLYLLDQAHNLCAVSLNSHAICWKAKLPLTRDETDVDDLSCAEDGTMVFVLTSKGRVFAVDTETGNAVRLNLSSSDSQYDAANLLLCGEYLAGIQSGDGGNSILCCDLADMAAGTFEGNPSAGNDTLIKKIRFPGNVSIRSADPAQAALIAYESKTGEASVVDLKAGSILSVKVSENTGAGSASAEIRVAESVPEGDAASSENAADAFTAGRQMSDAAAAEIVSGNISVAESIPESTLSLNGMSGQFSFPDDTAGMVSGAATAKEELHENAEGRNTGFPTDSSVAAAAADTDRKRIAVRMNENRNRVWIIDETSGAADAIPMIKKVDGFFFCRGFLIVISDDGLYRYDPETGENLGVVNTGEIDASSFDNGDEVVLDDARSLIRAQNGTEYLLLDTAGWYVLCTVPAEAYFNGDFWFSGSIDVSGNYGIYTYPMYTMNDLKEKLQKKLNGNELSEDDRQRYGIA